VADSFCLECPAGRSIFLPSQHPFFICPVTRPFPQLKFFEEGKFPEISSSISECPLGLFSMPSGQESLYQTPFPDPGHGVVNFLERSLDAWALRVPFPTFAVTGYLLSLF